jgi:hypothetical protein
MGATVERRGSFRRERGEDAKEDDAGIVREELLILPRAFSTLENCGPGHRVQIGEDV